MKRVIIVCAVFSFLYTGLAVRTDAEVRVRTRPGGEYVETLVIPGGPPWRQGVWSTRARMSLRRGSAVLNPHGDRMGDLMPSIGEQRRAPHHPLVVWSRFNGTDYDLVYASWRYAWSPISPVTSASLGGDDLDPSVAFSRVGFPVIAWWNRDLEDGHGTVYYSIFGGTGWQAPVKISDDSVGGRNPVIEVGNGTFLIHYTPDDGSGLISYPLSMTDPTTITDDIDPQGTLPTGGGNESDSPRGVKDKS